MKFYKESIDPCSGSKIITILGNSKRALFGLYPGYISLFYRIFYTKFELVNMEIMGDVLNTCDVERMTQSKFNAFLDEPLSFREYIYYFYIKKYFRRKETNVLKYTELI